MYKEEFRKISSLLNSERELLVNLYLKYYISSSREIFFKDLENKDEVLILYYDEKIIGFTTLQIYESIWKGEKICVVFSGDTIVERVHWGQLVLSFQWIKRIGELKKRIDCRLFWFLIVKGHRTYRYLPAFAKNFYPHWSIDCSYLKPLLDFLALEKFGDQYNPVTGVVEFTESHGHLNSAVSLPSEAEKNNAAVKFFLKRNPNYVIGHELACLFEFNEENMKPLTRRIFAKGLAHG
jgi:hypothetical protein